MKLESRSRVQYAALPYRLRDNGLEVLLITSRESRRWVIPKGWPMKSPRMTAGREALQEAGVRGHVHKKAIGAYSYVKRGPAGEEWPCTVTVFPLSVQLEQMDWREAEQRTRQWFSQAEAQTLVEEPGLRLLIGKLESTGSSPST